MDLSLFERYQAELKEILSYDEFNVKDIQLKLPSIKHNWVARKAHQKFELKRLKELRAEALDKVSDKIRDEEHVGLSQRALNNAAAKHEVIVKIDNEIAFTEGMIDYLDDVVQYVFRNMTFDIKNFIELVQQETM